MAKAVWGIVAFCLGASNVPRSFSQCWNWCECWLPVGQKFHVIGIAAVCWAIWKTQNNVCFQGKIITSPITIVCYTCSLISYWAGMFDDSDEEELVAGAETMLKIALQLVGKSKDPEEQVMLEDGH
jgi:hypothetical protein